MQTSSNQHITCFARTLFRNEGQLFGIKKHDRRSHMYIVGKTGTGKSTLLRSLMSQDVERGEGLALFDPHGDLAESMLPLIPQSRNNDLIYLDVPDTSKPWHFNPLADIPPEKHALAVAGLVEVFKKIWNDEWGPRLEHLLRNVLFTLLAMPGTTLGDIPTLLTNKKFRQQAAEYVDNDEVRAFWETEYERYSDKFRAVVIAPLQNKLGALLTDPLLNSILTGANNSFDLRQIMDEGKILLVNLARGKIGEGPASILGSLLVAHLSLAGLARADQSEKERRDFFLYLDEFQTFATRSLATMLSELRKYRVNLILAHQYLSQLDPVIRDAVLGNAATMITFRVGAPDARILAQELVPRFDAENLVRLPNYQIYIKLMIDGEVSMPFSAETLAPEPVTSQPFNKLQ